MAPSTLSGLIPTAWYPFDLALDGRRNRLVVSALKGLGPDVAEQGSVHNVLHLAGLLSLINVPTHTQLMKETQQPRGGSRTMNCPT